MEKQKYYRSPIDELVSKSGMSAKAISQEMGIKYHRMVALRRLKNVQDNDLQNCERAIAALKDNPKAYRKPGQPKKQTVKNPYAEPDKVDLFEAKTSVESPTIQKIKYLANHKRKEHISNLSFLLGQTLGFIQSVFDSLQVNDISIPDKVLERKKQLEEQCNKLLDI